jgi:ADP-ribose pyrophosphatase
MQLMKTLSRQVILEHGRYLTVESHQVELPDGRVISHWPWLVTPSFVNVIATTPEGKFLCFRQTKYAVAGVTLAPVGGYLEPGEDPLEAAKRELWEESGYTAPDWVKLGEFVVDANRGAGIAHFYLARQAAFHSRRESDDLEEHELIELDSAELQKALLAGEFKALPWVAVVALALIYLSS